MFKYCHFYAQFQISGRRKIYRWFLSKNISQLNLMFMSGTILLGKWRSFSTVSSTWHWFWRTRQFWDNSEKLWQHNAFLADIIFFSACAQIYHRGNFLKKKNCLRNFSLPHEKISQDCFEIIWCLLQLSKHEEDQDSDCKKNNFHNMTDSSKSNLCTQTPWQPARIIPNPYQNVCIDGRMISSKAWISIFPLWWVRGFNFLPLQFMPLWEMLVKKAVSCEWVV